MIGTTPWPPLVRRVAAGFAALSTVAATAVALSSPATAATGFTAGDLVVYRVGTGAAALTSSGTAVSLDEYSPTGSAVQSVALPTVAAGANNPIVSSGTASSEGLLTLSADSNYLVATGYDTSVGTTKVSGSTVPRTIARVDASDTVNTTTALTDFAPGNNPRSATSADGTQFWVGGAAGGVRYATLGASTSTSLTSSTYSNVREVQDVGGQLYTSADPTQATPGITIATVGTGLPTSGTQTLTDLVPATGKLSPYGYSLLTLGSGTAPDTLYVADNGSGAVLKYSLVNGTWTAEGSAVLGGVDGLTANDAGGVVSIYATTASGLYSMTDSSGAGGTFSGSATLIASAASNTAFRGVAFAPGTVIGSGGAPPTATPPTITAANAGLPAALGDPTVPSTTLTVADTNYPSSRLTVSGSSSNQQVAADSGISITASGATRTLSVTPAGAVGDATITLTVSAPDGTSSTTSVAFGASQDVGQPSAHYYSGAGNASAAIDVGNGYALVGDDENNLLRLYDLSRSGPPLKTFDFTSQLPFGSTEIDIEAAARSGNTIYWEGSMSNTSGGNPAPSRSTIFATTISGSGANTTLSYVGAYTGLRQDLITWDQDNGNALGLAASAATGVGGHQSNALNLEGMEFAGSSSTLYLSFRAPLEPTTDRHLALLVPLTDVTTDIAAGPTANGQSTFGAPIELDLGGLGVRDIKQNADGQYLVIAGSADDTNAGFVLYDWDGNPNDDPQPTGTTLPQLPSANNAGSWETIVSVPEPLTSGSSLRLIQDDGTVAWYGDGLTTKTGLLPDLQKSLGVSFTYQAPAARASQTTLTQDPASAPAGTSVTYTAAVGPAAGNGTPTGTVDFQDGGTDVAGCAAQPISAGVATCAVTYTVLGSHSITAGYSGDGAYQPSTSATVTHTVTGGSVDHLVVSPAATTVPAGTSQAYSAEAYDTYGNDLGDVTGSSVFDIAPQSGANGASCSGTSCTATAAGTYAVTATDGSATGTARLDVVAGPVATLTVAPADASSAAGTAVDYTASGQDAYGNPTGDETAATTFSIMTSTGGSSMTGAACTGASCSATAAGGYLVDASAPTTSGTATGSTTLTVTPGPLSTLTLSPANAAVRTGQAQSYTATGADRYGNDLGDETAQSTFTIDGAGRCSANSCTAPDAGTHTVTGQDGPVTGTATLTVSAPPSVPAVTGVSPTSGPTTGSTTVTVTGTGFAGATGVTFGTTSATGVTVVSDTQLTAVSPAHSAGVVDVHVTGPAGTSPSATADRFTYTVPPRPSVTSLSPGRGLASGGTTVTITGKGLTGASSVSFGGTVTTNVSVLSPTQLQVVSPAHVAATVDVGVVTPGGTSAASSGDKFTFTPLTPAVSALAPSTGTTLGGTTVTVSGAGFTGVQEVDLGSTAATKVTVVSDTKLTVVTPAHAAGAVAVTVVTGTGTSSGGPSFTFVTPLPRVTGVAPASGSTSGGTTVTITGTTFTGATQVSFGSVAATSFTVVSDTTITAVTPAQSAGARNVIVTTPAGASKAVTADRFTYVVTSPSVTSVSPKSGPVAGGTQVTIGGTRLGGATAVYFGSVAATSFTVVSATRITAVTPAGSTGKVGVSVVSPGGTSPASSAATYTYV